MWNWTEQTLISQGQGWLRSLAQLTQFRDSRPRVGRTDKPHQTMSLSVICLKSGKVEGEGSGGWSVFSRMGEWCLNTKINLFHFQKHYLFIIFLIFIFFGAGGGHWWMPQGRGPTVTTVSWVLGRWEPRASHQSGLAGRIKGGPPLGMFQAAVVLWPPGRTGRTWAVGVDTGRGRVRCGKLTRSTHSTLFFFCFIFIKEKGACQLSSPMLHDSLCCVVLFCKLYNF